MRRSGVKESDFFKQTNISLTKRHKIYLNNLKERAILSTNLNIDNPTFVRAMLSYLNDHPEIIDNIKDYIVDNRGNSYVAKYTYMKSKNMSNEEISEALGVDLELINKISKSE